MTPQQFTMDLMPPPSFARDDFVLSGCNAMAADWIDRWPDWPGRIQGLVLYGPPSCGKSHLAAIWQSKSKAKSYDRIDDQTIFGLDDNPHMIWDQPLPSSDWPEDLIFHLLNRLTEIEGSLLILSHQPMAAIDWQIADVASRLNGLSGAEITDPDDDMLMALLFKHADDLGMALDDDVARYIITRMDRRFDAAQQMMVQLNQTALSVKKNVTIPLVRDVLEEQLNLY